MQPALLVDQSLSNRVTAASGLQAAQIVAGMDLKFAGPTYSIPGLASGLARAGARVEILTIGEPSRSVEGDVAVTRFRQDFTSIPVLRNLCLSRELDAEIGTWAARGAVLHTHGLWLMPNIYSLSQARKYHAPVVLSPRGMLAPAALGFSSRKKALFSLLVQRRMLDTVSCFHATCDEERNEIRGYGLRAPVAIIPNGIDIAPLDRTEKRNEQGERVALYLGRVHPKKGLDGLLEAWSRVEATNSGWRLEVVGPSEIGYGDKLIQKARALNLRRVSFKGEVYGDEKLAVYRKSDVFVLPSLNENFGMVVAESLAAGTPVISTKGAPWRGLVENDCGWWIDHGVDPLAAALSEAMMLPRARLAAMGENGRAWMERNFSWEQVAVQMASVYCWLLSDKSRPACVSLD